MKIKAVMIPPVVSISVCPLQSSFTFVWRKLTIFFITFATRILCPGRKLWPWQINWTKNTKVPYGGACFPFQKGSDNVVSLCSALFVTFSGHVSGLACHLLCVCSGDHVLMFSLASFVWFLNWECRMCNRGTLCCVVFSLMPVVTQSQQVGNKHLPGISHQQG